jgi:AraC family transcriptional regulator
MPYARVVLAHTNVLAWEHIALLDPRPDWGQPYQPQSARLLLPLEHCVHVELSGQRFVVDAGAALWLTPHHSYRLRQTHIGQRSMLLVMDADDDQARRCPITPLHHWRLHRLAVSAARGDWLRVEVGAADLIGELLRHPLPRSKPHRAVEAAREFLASDPTRDDDLSTIARAAACSPFHLARLFRHHTGRSLHAHRDDLRMMLALERLHGGETHLARLAVDLGYAHHSHFSAAFKRHFGATPTQMRRNLTAPMC